MKRVKTQYLIGRVDEPFKAIVADYINRAFDLNSESDLIRRAVVEYMRAHPIKQEQQV